MGAGAGTGEAPWPGTLPVMPPLPPLARGATVGHMGSHAVRVRTLLNVIELMTRATRLRRHLPAGEKGVKASKRNG